MKFRVIKNRFRGLFKSLTIIKITETVNVNRNNCIALVRLFQLQKI